MFFAAHNEVARSRDMTTAFGGYNHRLSCQDGEFFDMKNMTTAYYPMLSPRNKRGNCRQFTNPNMLTDKDGLVWFDNGVLYVDGEETSIKVLPTLNFNHVKMGSRLVFGNATWTIDMETLKYDSLVTTYYWGGTRNILPMSDFSKMYEYRNASWYEDGYEPKDGAYAIFEEDGKHIMKQWNEASKTWNVVTGDYVYIGINNGNTLDGPSFEIGQTIKITVDNSKNDFDPVIGLFPINEGNGKYSVTTTVVNTFVNEKGVSMDWATGEKSIPYDGIVIEGSVSECLLFGTAQVPNSITIEPERVIPEFITECNNRLWGCSADGHEIYATTLGSWKRWQCYEGVSTDAYAVTIGSDGEFTGSVTYNGNPIFFKENSMVKITVSSTGAHQVKEVFCPGVQKGSENSICIINGILYYKGVEGIYAYDGSLPVLVSSSLGEVRYYKAVSGTILDRYYVSMKDGNGLSHLFVYDTSTGMWAKEDNTDAMVFCRSKDELYYIDNADKKLKSVRGTLLYEGGDPEGAFDWFAESGNIGFTMPDKKHMAKLQIRLSMELGTNVSIFLQYDSSGNWEHVCNINGTGTRSFTVPIIPRRCDHFKYMIGGRGGCKIFSVTKTIEEGSEL